MADVAQLNARLAAALKAMQDGDLAVTVFQDAVGQGAGSIDTALNILAGKKVEKTC